MDDDDDWYESEIGGVGSASDLNGSDPRNPRLAGLRSVSYAAAVAIRRNPPKSRPIGFHIPRAKR